MIKDGTRQLHWKSKQYNIVSIIYSIMPFAYFWIIEESKTRGWLQHATSLPDSLNKNDRMFVHVFYSLGSENDDIPDRKGSHFTIGESTN
jgi:hypothetical protein